VQAVQGVHVGLDVPPQVPVRYWPLGQEDVHGTQVGLLVAVHEPDR